MTLTDYEPDEAENDDEWATYCADCGCMIGPGEEGHGYEECIECGSTETQEVPY